jgi:site-specific DNA recombinase
MLPFLGSGKGDNNMNYDNNKDNNLRYIAYLRKSTEDDERQVLSKQAQESKIKERFPDLNIIDYVDESKSAFEPGKREVFDKIIAMLDAGEVDGIVCWHPDRLSRNEVEAAHITMRIRRNVLKDLKFANYTFDNSPEGIMMLQLTMSQSQYFSAKLSKDVKRGNEQKRKNGGITGKAPEGYVNDRIKKTVHKDPVRWPLLRQAVEMMLTGEYSVPVILDWLNNEKGYRTIQRSQRGGGKLSRASLYRVFNSVRSAGWIQDPHNRELMYPAEYAPLMSQEEFDRIQSLLGSKAAKKFATRKQFALRGLIYCGECGCMITAQSQEKKLRGGGSNTHIYYHCTRKSKLRLCKQRYYVKEDDLYKQCEDLLNEYELAPELYAWSMEALNEMLQEEQPERESAQAMQTQAITDTEAQLDRLLDMSTRGLVDEETFVSKASKLKSILKELNKQQAEDAKKVESWYDFMSDTFLKLTGANAKFVNGEFADKKEILLAIGQNPILLNGKLSITPDEWLIPIKQNAKRFNSELDRVKTMPQQMKKSLLQALSLEWCGSGDSNPWPRPWQGRALNN